VRNGYAARRGCGTRGVGVVAAAVPRRGKAACRRVPYTEVLDGLDGRITWLRRVKDERERLSGRAELLAGILGFSEELEGRCLDIRGLFGLQARVE